MRQESGCSSLRVYAMPAAGDLDNFLTGICDGLMAAHPLVPVDASLWLDVPEAARPDHAIAFSDDACVSRIVAERLPPDAGEPRYELALEW